MKIAACYYSRHHGNTRKVLEAMAEAVPMDLYDVTARAAVRLEEYDLVGLASGVYGFETEKAAADFARQYLPAGKPVFLVCTYGGAKGAGTKRLAEAAREKNCPVLGEFSCRGLVTCGPFGLVGGVGKDRPNAADLQAAKAFILRLAGE